MPPSLPLPPPSRSAFIVPFPNQKAPRFTQLSPLNPLTPAPVLLPYPRCSNVPPRRSEKNRLSRSARKRTRRRHEKEASSSYNRWASVRPVAAPPTRASDLRPESCPALVLNADYSPLSYMPLSLWAWQDVVKAVFLDRVTVVATYDIGVRSPNMIFPLPSVISLKEYQPMAVKKPAFTRFNVFMRDSFSCQYCSVRLPTQELTFDHVVPRCKGGRTNWTNVVTACITCNHRKGRSMLSELHTMKLKRLPTEPTSAQLQVEARKFPPPYLHESWRDYIYWNQSMKVEAEQK